MTKTISKTRSGRPMGSIPDPPQVIGPPPPVLEAVETGDARIVIETSQQRNTQVLGMASLTPNEITEAIRRYQIQKEKQRNPNATEHQQAENSGNSQESRRESVFRRLGAQGNQNAAHKAQSKARDSEAERLRKLAEIAEQIRQEEEAKLEQVIQKRISEEEDKLLRPSGSKRPRAVSPEPLSPVSESEPQNELARMVRELQKQMGTDSGLEIEGILTPFSRSLEAMPRQTSIKHYNFDSFDGLKDPEEHLHYFEQIAMIYFYNDITKCRFFASTLKGGAQKWFNHIVSRSIHSWNDLRESFLRRFRANRTHELHMCHLETIRQYDNESLSAFMKRFQEAINKVSHLDEREALSVFRRNLDPGQNERYVIDLINKEPQSLAAAYTMAAKFIKETDVLKAMKMTRNVASSPRISVHDRIQDNRPRPEHQPDKRFKPTRESNYIQSSQLTVHEKPARSGYQTDSRPPRNTKYEPRPEPEWTPLNRSREDILKEVRGKPYYYPPKPLITAPEN